MQRKLSRYHNADGVKTYEELYEDKYGYWEEQEDIQRRERMFMEESETDMY